MSELHKLKVRYNFLPTNITTKSLMRRRQSYFERSKKAGNLLAWRIKQLQTEKAINCIHSNKGIVTADPKEIND